MKSLFYILLACTATLLACSDNQSDEKNAFYIDSIATPEGLTAEVAALDALPDGRIVATFMRGEVMIYNPETKEWKLFASGLHEPLGIKAISDKEMLVMQLPELTRITDTDNDGEADLFETIYDGFGMTGNYHEFTYGPVQDKNGNLYIALNSSSSGGGMSDELRGDTLMIGKMRDGNAMFSVVPYRGWVMKIDKNFKLTPFASGFRSPNGIALDAKDRLYVTENQGDWVGTSPLYHVEEGKHYGHPASIVWTKGWNRGNPFDLPVDTLDKMREKPTVIFPHDLLANSPTQPILIKDNKKLKAFEGQFIIGEMSSECLVRVMLEEVNGVMQGAATVFIQGQGLRKGNNRLVFSPNGDLWVGQADHGWLGDRGIQRIRFTGKTIFDIKDMKITKRGFELNFTDEVANTENEPIDSLVHVRRYRYHYHKKYGSEQIDIKNIKINKADWSKGRKQLQLQLEPLEKGFVYEVALKKLKNEKLTDSLQNKLVMYTVKSLREY